MSASFDFAGFRLDLKAQHLSFRSTPIKLTAKAMTVLGILVERAPEVVSRAEFEAQVWPDGFIEPANLTQTIYMLRKALGAHSPTSLIETVNGRGYRLTADVALRHSSTRDTRLAAGVGVGTRAIGWRTIASAALVVALVVLIAAARLSQHGAVQTATSPSTNNAGAVTRSQAAPAQSL